MVFYIIDFSGCKKKVKQSKSKITINLRRCVDCSADFFLFISAHRWNNTKHNMEMYSAHLAAVQITSLVILSIHLIWKILNGLWPSYSSKTHANCLLSFDVSRKFGGIVFCWKYRFERNLLSIFLLLLLMILDGQRKESCFFFIK